MKVAGLILAGGKGSRFGGADKAFVELAGKPFIAHVLARLQPQVLHVAISANGDPTRFLDYALPILPDDPAFQERGPLAGVLSGLRWADMQKMDFVLTTPVDTPYLPVDLRAQLWPGPSVALHKGRTQPLAALWPVGFAGALEAFLRQPGKHKVSEALGRCQAREVAVVAPDEAFANINTPEELASLSAGTSAATFYTKGSKV